MATCPSTGQLEQWLNDDLTATDQESIQSHVDVCSACQSSLDELTAAPSRGGADDRLSRSAAHNTISDTEGTSAAPVPKVIGQYTILGELGHGGMGLVLRGRDPEFNRVLAVKVLLDQHKGDAHLTARFLEEGQITGQLQHPGIAPVHHRGRLPDGRPFFTMKLIQGQTLEELIATRQRPGDDLPRVLDIFGQVCQTMAYAHSHGVIHRDLKPANVMVGKFGEVQVMDWGLAKVIGKVETSDAGPAPGETVIAKRPKDSAGESEAGTVLGTPGYIAPEQARGESGSLDARCDVFGLGAILCFMLTGQPAHTGRSGHEMLVKAMKGDLSGAQARLAACRADTELIDLAQKCLAAEKEQRPRDAGVVSQALAAYGARVQERLRVAEMDRAAAEAKAREERKRRKVVAALALAVLTVAVLVGGGAWYYHDEQQTRANELARRRQDTHQAVSPALAKAEQLGAQASALPVASSKDADAALVVWQQAQDALAQAEVALRTGVADDGLGQRIEDLRGRIGEGRVRADQYHKQASRRERLFRDLDDARMALANHNEESTFDYAGAALKYAAAFAQFGLDVQSGPTEVLAQRIRAEEPAVREALIVALDLWAICGRTTPGNADLSAIARAADDDAWRQGYRQAMVARDGTALVRLSGEARRLDVPPTSLLLLAIALVNNDRREHALDLLRWARGRNPTDFWIALHLGTSLAKTKPSDAADLEERIGCYRVAVALRPGASVAHNNLGTGLKAKNELDDAIVEYHKAIALNPNYAVAYSNLGAALQAKNQLDDAIAAHKTAIALDPKNASHRVNLGLALIDNNQLDDAIAECSKAVALGPESASAHNGLGNALARKNRLDDAIVEHKKAVALDPKHALYHSNLGTTLQVKNQLDDAIVAFNKAIELDPNLVLAHYNLGNALKDKNRLDDAIAEYHKAIEVEPKLAHAHNGLANALTRKNRLDDAIAEHHKAIALAPKVAAFHSNLGITLQAKNHLDDAIVEYTKASELEPKWAYPHNGLGNAFLAQSKFAQAEASFRRCLELFPANDPKRAIPERGLKQARRFLELDKKLPSILSGEAKPTDVAECLDLAALCQNKKLNAAAARFCTLAFAERPALADNLANGMRYNAACSAALAAAGQANDADKLSDQQRADWRRQGLQWLRADLAAWGKLVEQDAEKARPVVQRQMSHWQQDTDLAGVRDPKVLEQLPQDERNAWQQLWQDVDALLAKTREKK